MKRRMLGLLAAVTLASTALSACSSGNDAPAGGSADDPVSLRIAWWGSDSRHAYTQQVIDLYTSKHPNVKIDVEYASFDDYWKKLAPQAAAKQLPDIVQMDISYISQYAKNGQLAELEPYLNNQIQVGDVSESVLGTGLLGGKQYGIPIGVNVLGFHYDPELLKKGGIDSIPADWTWEKYEEMARQTGSKGLYFDSGFAPDIFFNYYLRTKGETLYNEEGNALGYDDDKLFTDFFRIQADLVKEKALRSPDYLNQIKGVLEESDLVKGTGIGVFQWSNQFVGLQKAAARPLALAPMMGPDMEKGIYMQPSMYWAITNNSKAKEEAAKFIDFWVNDVEANKIIKGERGVPISSAIKEAIAGELDEPVKQVFDFVSEMEPKASPMSPPPPTGSPEVIAALADLIEELNFGRITPEQAAASFRKTASEVLAANK
ncbi:ABC transporter substrate-binding protein [Paenibacillus pasadenensis]|uniref:Putative rhamnose oligosaccharide ABC transport system, substrate-binding component n=1 Tax=Paenibacillus pasadenensis TaxID=217090 RepID=A0A2N5N1Q3_9BACL|nr:MULTISPECIES: ABC transporter substrate-binding protein [Paenibacillus]PLT44253.1 putative rhamnose oligosaccharide ABC transport system, substrate-binding component [Paenibacillus pasadenensis]QGG54777.1 extracellular solute-binding protein [Paenibacillus sp. B01]